MKVMQYCISMINIHIVQLDQLCFCGNSISRYVSVTDCLSTWPSKDFVNRGIIFYLKVDNASTTLMRKLWVWSHPKSSDDAAKEIVHACSLEGPTEYKNEKSWLSKETDADEENMVTYLYWAACVNNKPIMKLMHLPKFCRQHPQTSPLKMHMNLQ